ncbi:MAG: glycosyltransferase, partial [Actinomycetota bacterium]|nr:glycosyltransferase [Actinomycetota bacterium]
MNATSSAIPAPGTRAEGNAAVAPASIAISAHDESGVIGRCLRSLLRHGAIDDVEVVVVANGCRDDTAERARDFADRIPGLTVVELGPAGKIGALNVGDARARKFPR